MILDAPLVWLSIAILAVIVFCRHHSKKKKSRHGQLPPGPTPLPIIGNLHQLRGAPPHLAILKLSRKIGDVMQLRLGSVSTVVVSSADAAQDIFRTNDLTISNRPSTEALLTFSYQLSSMSMAPYGDYWREVRKIVTKELFTPKQVQSFQQIRTEEVNRVVDQILNRISEPVDLSSIIFKMVTEVVCRVVHGAVAMAIGTKGYMKLNHDQEALLGMVNIADSIPWLGWINKINGMDHKMQKHFEKVDNFLNSAIKVHRDPTRQKSEQEDIVDVLLRVQKNSNTGFQLTDHQIKGILMDLFMGGTGSTSVTIVWAMTELQKNPKTKRAAQKEVRDVGNGKLQIDDDDLLKLPYLKQVVKETLRLHPPVPLLLPRETTEDCAFVGDGGARYRIPKGTTVLFNATAIQTDPRHWDNPNQFMPERFADRKVDFRGKHFVLMPFGAGRRSCPGINFATPTVELALANLLYRFDWECPDGMAAEDIDMEEAVGITVHKKSPLYLVATDKLN